jgi:hypothetical protein
MKPNGKAPMQNDQPQKPQKAPQQMEFAPNQCHWCKKTGHWKKQCPKWLHFMWSKGEDIITFVDESLYLSYSKSTLVD